MKNTQNYKFFLLLALTAVAETVRGLHYSGNKEVEIFRVKRGFGAAMGYGDGSQGYGVSGHLGGAAGLAQMAANQAKAAQAAQGPASHQAGQQARAILAAQASQLAQQALAVVAAKQAQVAQISQAANAAQAAAMSEAAQTAKARSAVHAAEVSKYYALNNSRYYGGRRQLYAAQSALQEARNVAAWQAQMSHQAQQNAIALSNKLKAAYADLAQAQAAANKASRASSVAQSSINVYG